MQKGPKREPGPPEKISFCKSPQQNAPVYDRGIAIRRRSINNMYKKYSSGIFALPGNPR
jgi:hypothetical protein